MKNTQPPIMNVVSAMSGQSIVGGTSIGAMLIDSGKITPDDAERIIRYARERSVRFGDAAVALKLVSDADIQLALAKQFAYPYLTTDQSEVSDEVVAAWAPFSEQVEALRALRSQLLLRWFTRDAEQKLLAVVSPARGDGRTHLAANIAVVFSQMGERTLLVDADLRNARQHELFGLRNSTGLSTVLAERTGIEAIQRVPGFVDLSVLPAGPTPPNPLELLGRGSFDELMRSLASDYDVVIVDTPAASFGSDYQLVAQKTKGVLLVGRRNKTPVDACAEVAEEARAAGAIVVGGVLNEH